MSVLNEAFSKAANILLVIVAGIAVVVEMNN